MTTVAAGFGPPEEAVSCSLGQTGALLMCSSRTRLVGGVWPWMSRLYTPSRGAPWLGLPQLLDMALSLGTLWAQEDCRRQVIGFLPMAAESYVGWHSIAEQEVKKLGTALTRHTGQKGEAVRHHWGRLGILLQWGNATLLGNRVSSHPYTNILIESS